MKKYDIFGKDVLQRMIDDIRAKLSSVALTGKYIDLIDRPESMKNPKALTFTGAVTGSYDGSVAKTIEIPSKTIITNNYKATEPGTAADAVLAKELREDVDELKSRFNYYAFLDESMPVEQRRNTYRGNNLGSEFTAEQKAQVRAGTFKGLFLGDYWVINGITWRIVDINYWRMNGDTNMPAHHIVIMPDAILYKANMNDTDSTTGGYVGSKMYTENLEEAKTIVNAAFGSANILNHREFLINKTTDGRPTSGEWRDSTVDLPNEPMIFGYFMYAPASTDPVISRRTTNSKTQLALMRVHPFFISYKRETFWLRDTADSKEFSRVRATGVIDVATASSPYGVRPVFGIVG